MKEEIIQTKIGEMKVVYVDGLKIRNTIDTNFGVIGSSRVYPFIPKGEIWFDEYYMDEKEHFFKVLLYELELMQKMSYEQARKIIEKELVTKIDKIPDYVVRTDKYHDFNVKYVDGRIIRKYIDPKFIMGMHGVDARDYDYAKEDEIWVDIRQKEPDQKYSLIHEYEEARLMKEWGPGDKNSYNNAHDFALVYEKIARRKDGAVYLQD